MAKPRYHRSVQKWAILSKSGENGENNEW
jgi:hypothetical protein